MVGKNLNGTFNDVLAHSCKLGREPLSSMAGSISDIKASSSSSMTLVSAPRNMNVPYIADSAYTTAVSETNQKVRRQRRLLNIILVARWASSALPVYSQPHERF